MEGDSQHAGAEEYNVLLNILDYIPGRDMVFYR
jgi:hypothetical protein